MALFRRHVVFQHVFQPGTSGRTLLLLHGTGGDEHDLLPLGQTLDPSAALLSVRGRIDENGSNRFFRRFQEGVFDLESLAVETAELAKFLQGQIKERSLHPGNLYAVGFSNGANMGASLMLRHPELFKGGFLMRAMFVFEPEEPPAVAGLRVLLASGETDPMVPRESVERLATQFVEGGADVEHIWVSGGHQLTRQELAHAKDWLAR